MRPIECLRSCVTSIRYCEVITFRACPFALDKAAVSWYNIGKVEIILGGTVYVSFYHYVI